MPKATNYIIRQETERKRIAKVIQLVHEGTPLKEATKYVGRQNKVKKICEGDKRKRCPYENFCKDPNNCKNNGSPVSH